MLSDSHQATKRLNNKTFNSHRPHRVKVSVFSHPTYAYYMIHPVCNTYSSYFTAKKTPFVSLRPGRQTSYTYFNFWDTHLCLSPMVKYLRIIITYTLGWIANLGKRFDIVYYQATILSAILQNISGCYSLTLIYTCFDYCFSRQTRTVPKKNRMDNI